MYSLIQDFIANGICEGLPYPFVPGLPNPFVPPTTSSCLFSFDQNGEITGIITGTCSAQTETLMQSIEECGYVLRQQRNLIFETLIQMLQFMCSSETVGNLIAGTNINITNRLVPIELVTEYDDATISTDLSFSK